MPTRRRLGIDVTLPQFRVVVARKGTPPERLQAMADAVPPGEDTPQWKKFAEEWYFAPDSYMGPDRFGKWVAGEIDTPRPPVKEFEGSRNSVPGAPLIAPLRASPS